MKIIGTGLSGLVGSRIVELLGNKYEFVDFSYDSGIDITDFNLLKSAFQDNKDAPIVLHLAAFTDVNSAWQQKNNKNGICYKVNVVGTENIANLCAEASKYLINISTDFVFDGKKQGVYTEEDKPNPIEWYGQTKLWAEEKIQKTGCRYTILRLGFPFKAKSAEKNLEPKIKLDLVRNIKNKLGKREKIKMFNDQIITPTFIDDVVKVLDIIFNKKPLGVFHLVGSQPLSPFELAKKIANVFDLDQQLIEPSSLDELVKISDRPRQRNLAISNSKLTQKFGLHLKTIDESLEILKQQILGE